MFKKYLSWLTALLMITVLVGCATQTSVQPTPGEQPHQGPKHLRVAYRGVFQGWDPHKATAGTDQEVLWAVFDSLLRVDNNGNIIPGQVKEWTFSNPTTLVLNLHDGIKFTDGTPLDAEAVKWNLDRIKNPDQKLPVAPQLNNVSKIEVTGPLQVTLSLTKPAASLLAALTDRVGMMVSPTAMERLGADFARTPVSAGPFTLVEHRQDALMVVERNPNFFETGMPKLDKISFFMFNNADSANSALRSGQIDLYVKVPPLMFGYVASNRDFTFIDAPTIGFTMIHLNKVDPPLNNLKLRQAMAHAIDREAILEAVYGGVGTVAEGFMPSGFWAKDPAAKQPAYDTQKAMQLVQESGYDGAPIRVVVKNEGEHVQIMEIVQQMWDKVGIKATLAPMHGTAAYEEQAVRGTAPARALEFSGRVDPDLTIALLFESGGAHNAPVGVGGLKDPRVEDLIQRARSATSLADRTRLYHELDRLLTSEVHAITFVHYSWATAIRNNITGFAPNPLGKPFYLYFDMK